MTTPLRRPGCTRENPCHRADCQVCETQAMFGRRTGEGLNPSHHEVGPGDGPNGGVVSPVRTGGDAMGLR
jgi:hypothetical protein